MLLPVFKPYIRRADMDSVLSCLISDEIGPGSISKELTTELCNYLELSDGFLIRDYYRAISLAIDTLELKSGSRVILSPLSPGAYIDVLMEKGIIAIFADVDPDTAIMDTAKIDQLLENNIDAIILHCPLGSVADMNYFTSLGIPLIEDISENFGAMFNEKKCGSFGNVTLFSMEPDQILTCGGGSAVFVNNSFYYEKLKIICKSFSSEIFLSDINASLALVQLKNIEEILEKRNELAKLFHSALNKTEHKSIKSIDGSSTVHFSFPILIKGGMKEVKAYIMKKNIESRKAFLRTALDVSGNKENICPIASGLILRSLLLPLYPSLGKKNAEIISKVITTLP